MTQPKLVMTVIGGHPMIVKTFFLAKEIHRIGTRSIRGKKGLHENLAGNGTFFALRATRGRALHKPPYMA
jgi:hypothetical protein